METYALLYIKQEHIGTKVSEIIENEVRDANLDVKDKKQLVLTEEMLKIHQQELFKYISDEDKIWQEQVKERMINSNIIIFLVKGKDAINKVCAIKKKN